MKPTQVLQLVVLGLLWGSSYLFIKVAVEGIDPVTLVFGRLVIGSSFLYLMLRSRGLRLSRDRVTWLHILAMSLFGIIAPQVLIAWSEQYVTSAVAAILNATTPFFTLIFAAGIFQTERFSTAKATGLLVGFGGIAVMTGSGILNLAGSSAQGEVALILSAVGYGVAFAYARRFLKAEPLVLASGQMMLSAALIIPGVLLFGHPQHMDLTATRLIAWLALGTFSSGVAYILYYKLIAEIGATSASFGTYLIPIVGVFWGWLLLSEAVGVRTIVGVAMILIGLAIATGIRRRGHALQADVLPTLTADPVAVDD